MPRSAHGSSNPRNARSGKSEEMILRLKRQRFAHARECQLEVERQSAHFRAEAERLRKEKEQEKRRERYRDIYRAHGKEPDF